MNLLQQIKWQFMILHRNKLTIISLAITVVYAGIFYIFRDSPAKEGILTLLIYNDPAVIGMFFVGLSIIIEKNTSVLSAIFVTPITINQYLLSRILALSILGTACAILMAISALGFSFNFAYFTLGAFATCFLFSLGGILVLGNTTEFLTFMIKSIPILFLFSLPLLNYYEMTSLWIFNISPIWSPLNLVLYSYGVSISNTVLILSVVSTPIWMVGLYLFTKRKFIQNLIKII